VQGTLDLLLLKILALEPQHGWAISIRLKQVSGEVLSGRKQLETESANWDRLSSAIARVVRLPAICD